MSSRASSISQSPQPSSYPPAQHVSDGEPQHSHGGNNNNMVTSFSPPRSPRLMGVSVPDQPFSGGGGGGGVRNGGVGAAFSAVACYNSDSTPRVTPTASFRSAGAAGGIGGAADAGGPINGIPNFLVSATTSAAGASGTAALAMTNASGAHNGHTYLHHHHNHHHHHSSAGSPTGLLSPKTNTATAHMLLPLSGRNPYSSHHLPLTPTTTSIGVGALHSSSQNHHHNQLHNTSAVNSSVMTTNTATPASTAIFQDGMSPRAAMDLMGSSVETGSMTQQPLSSRRQHTNGGHQQHNPLHNSHDQSSQRSNTSNHSDASSSHHTTKIVAGGGSVRQMHGSGSRASSASRHRHHNITAVTARGGGGSSIYGGSRSLKGSARNGGGGRSTRYHDEDSEGSIDFEAGDDSVRRGRGGGGGTNHSSSGHGSSMNHTKPPEEEEHVFKKSKRPRFRCPLFFLLGLQVLIIVATFIVIITITAVRVENLTAGMVTEKVRSDLGFANQSIISPLLEHERTLHLVRDRYLTTAAVEGKEPCSDDSANFGFSEGFLTDGALIRLRQPDVVYVFHMRRSTKYFDNKTGEPQLVSCAAIPTGVLTYTNGMDRFSAPVSRAALERKMLSTYPYASRPDRVDFLIGLVRLGTPQFSWNTILYYDPDARAAFLYLIAFAPNLVNKTDANGTVIASYRPDLTGKQVPDATLTPVANTGLAINFTAFGTIMASVTPPAEGAHTSLYNLDKMQLISTSAEDCPLYNDQAERSALFSAGQTPSASVNEAFNALQGNFITTATVPSVSNGGSRYKMTALDFQVKLSVNDRVVSCIPITSDSGVNFVVVQSTPRSYYFTESLAIRDYLIIVGVVVGVAIMIVCLVVGLSIRFPLLKLREGMVLAAAMKNSRVVSSTSFLTDLDVLCASFDQMNDKLLQAREFMPQALLCESSSNDEEDGDGNGDDDGEDADGMYAGRRQSQQYRGRNRGGDDDSSMGSSRLYHHHGGAGGGGGYYDDDQMSMMKGADGMMLPYSSSSLSPRNLVGATGGGRGKLIRGIDGASQMTVSSGMTTDTDGTNHHSTVNGKLIANPKYAINMLQQKRVTILVVNTRSFHTKVSTSAPTTVQEPSSYLTGLINTICNREKGVIDAFHGDHFVLSFNAVKTNAQGPVKAARCALDIIAEGSGNLSSMNAVLTAAGGSNGRSAALPSGAAAVNMQHAQKQRLLGGGANGFGSYHTNASSVFNDTNTTTTNNSGGNNMLMGTNANASNSSGPTFVFSMGISTGRAIVGHLGTVGMKRLSIVGRVYSRALALERMCKRFNEETGYDGNAIKAQLTGGGDGQQQQQRRNNNDGNTNTNYRRQQAAAASNNYGSGNGPLGGLNNANSSTNNIASSSSCIYPTVEIITDALMASEVQHAYLLQVMGVMGEPIGDSAAVSLKTHMHNSNAQLMASIAQGGTYAPHHTSSGGNTNGASQRKSSPSSPLAGGGGSGKRGSGMANANAASASYRAAMLMGTHSGSRLRGLVARTNSSSGGGGGVHRTNTVGATTNARRTNSSSGGGGGDILNYYSSDYKSSDKDNNSNTNAAVEDRQQRMFTRVPSLGLKGDHSTVHNATTNGPFLTPSHQDMTVGSGGGAMTRRTASYNSNGMNAVGLLEANADGHHHAVGGTKPINNVAAAADSNNTTNAQNTSTSVCIDTTTPTNNTTNTNANAGANGAVGISDLRQQQQQQQLQRNQSIAAATLLLNDVYPMPSVTKDLEIVYAVRAVKHRSAQDADEWLYELNETAAMAENNGGGGNANSKAGGGKNTKNGGGKQQLSPATLKTMDSKSVGEMCLAAVNKSLLRYFETLQQNAISMYTDAMSGAIYAAAAAAENGDYYPLNSPCSASHHTHSSSSPGGVTPVANAVTTVVPHSTAMGMSVGLGGIATMATSLVGGGGNNNSNSVMMTGAGGPQQRSSVLVPLSQQQQHGSDNGFFNNSQSLANMAAAAAFHHHGSPSPTSGGGGGVSVGHTNNNNNTSNGSEMMASPKTVKVTTPVLGATVANHTTTGSPQLLPQLLSAASCGASVALGDCSPLIPILPHANSNANNANGTTFNNIVGRTDSCQQQQRDFATFYATNAFTSHIAALAGAKEALRDAIESIVGIYYDRLVLEGGGGGDDGELAALRQYQQNANGNHSAKSAALGASSMMLVGGAGGGGNSNASNLMIGLKALGLGRLAVEYALLLADDAESFYGVMRQD